MRDSSLRIRRRKRSKLDGDRRTGPSKATLTTTTTTVVNPAKGEQLGERGAGPPKSTGYRPGRKTQKRRSCKKPR
ncbi:MAG: hypothetical protein K8U57_00210 [Planctomycetes bacterium]|nr:hypothetical protein [Planctomycetota bacterium]